MPIKFKCSKCGQEMTVKDELAGKQGKCPGCKAVLTVPTPGAASKPAGSGSAARPAPPPPKQPVKKEEVEPVEAEVAEEEPIEAEVVEDEPPRKKKSDITDKPSPKRRRKEEEDEDERPRKRKKDEDEEDEEDERPRKRKSSITAKPSASRRRRRDEDEDEDRDDEEYEDTRRGGGRAERAGWQKARLGVFLNQISMWLYAGVWGMLIATFFLSCILGAAVATSRTGEAAGGAVTILRLLGYLMNGLWLGLWVTSLVGYIMAIMTPGKNGEKPLAITCTCLLGAELVLMVIMVFTSTTLLTGGFIGSDADPMALLQGAIILVLLTFLLEVARNTVFSAYVQAVGKTLRDRKTREGGRSLLILVPILGLAIPLFDYLLIRLMFTGAATGRGDGGGAAIMMLMMYFGTAGGFLFLSLFYAKKLGWAKETIEENC